MSSLRLIVACALSGLLLGGCGAAPEDPVRILGNTFGGVDRPISSGTIEATLDLSESGIFTGDAELSGRFDRTGLDSGTLLAPRFDLTFKLDLHAAAGADYRFEGGLLSTGRSLYLRYRDQTYRVGDEELIAAFTGNAGSSTGLSPLEWFEDPVNLGTVEVAGVATTRISSRLNVAAMLNDLVGVARRRGATDLSAVRDLAALIEDPRVDIYSGEQDRILRRFDVNFNVAAAPNPRPDSADSGAAPVAFSLVFGEINQPQQIKPPLDAKPLRDLAALLAGLQGQ